MASLRREVLRGYKCLMRARLVAFKGDTQMLEASRAQLRVEFNKNKGLSEPSKIGGCEYRQRLYFSGSCVILSWLYHTTALHRIVLHYSF